MVTASSTSSTSSTNAAQGGLPTASKTSLAALVGILSLCYLMVFFNRMAPAVLAGHLRAAFHVDTAFTGLLAAAFFYAYAVMQIPGGLLTDRFGPKRVIMASLVTAAAGLALFASASNAATALAGRTLIGLGFAAVLVPAYAILANWCTPQGFVTAASVVVSVGGLGSFLAGAPLVWCQELLGWRQCQLVLAGVSLGLAVLVWFGVRERPAMVAATRPSAPPFREAFRIVCASRESWLLGCWFFVNGAIAFSFAGLWAGPYFVQVRGWSAAEAGFLISLFGLGIIVGPLVGAAITRVTPWRPAVLALSKGLTFLALGWFWLYGASQSYAMASLWCVAFTAILGAPFGTLFALLKDSLPASVRGVASGFVYTFCMLGAAGMQMLVGLMLQGGSTGATLTVEAYSPVFVLYMALAAVAFAACLGVRDKR